MVLGFALPRYERPTLRGNEAEACLIVECGSWGGESGTHDVGPREHKLDGSLIHSQLLHHVWVLMQQLQSWEPLSIPIAEEKRCVVQNQQLRPIWTAEHMGASALVPWQATSLISPVIGFQWCRQDFSTKCLTGNVCCRLNKDIQYLQKCKVHGLS